MSAERISRATIYDADEKIIQTLESGLLIDGEVKSSIYNENNETLDYTVLGVVGEKNHTHHLDTNIWPKDDRPIVEHAEALRSNFNWYRHLIGRELAVRSIEMSVLTDIDISPDIVARTMRLTEGTKYDRLGRFRTNKPDIGFMKKWVKKDFETSGQSLGDLIAQERVYAENGMLTRVSLLLSTLMDTQPHLRLGKKMDYKQERQKKEISILDDALDNQEGLARTDRMFVADLLRIEGIREGLLSDEIVDALGTVKGIVEALKRYRSRGRSYYLDTTAPEARYNYFPSNEELYSDISQSAPNDKKEPRVTINPVSEADKAAQMERVASIRAAEEARRAEEREHEEMQKRAIHEHDVPILEELERIAAEHNKIIDEFIKHVSRSLREKGLVGKNSLEYALSQMKAIDDPDVASRTVRVYARLYDLAEQYGEDSLAVLTDQLLRLEQLQAEYSTYLQEHPLRGVGKPSQLEASVKPELSWLTQHFSELQDVISETRHAAHYTDKQYRSIAAMLGDEVAKEDEDENLTEETENPAEYPLEEPVVESTPLESPLVQANKLAEQLNWVVLPNESITPDDLVNIAEKTIRERSGDDKKPATVERYRMEALLQLREEYGGVLYRSDERTLGDSDNLYFVLRFQHPGDDNYYAVAENPVYGNATYVLREDALPLQPGETVLAAVRLTRKDVQYFGAQRIIHGTPSLEVHQEKINNRIVRLSERDAVATA